MDDIKDVAKKDHLTRFLGNRTLRIEAFGANISASRAYQRAERIVAALHLVTNHVSEREPARTLVRESGLDLLEHIFLLGDEMRNPESAASKGTHECMRKLVSGVRILSVSGHISPQNADALIEALDELGNFILVSQRTALSESASFEKEDFLDEGFETPPRRISDTRIAKETTRPIKDKREHREMSDRNAETTGQRGERILGVLKSQGQLGIKDIVSSLPEYSEKMIQRELKALGESGSVSKSGSKRWSVYSAVSS